MSLLNQGFPQPTAGSVAVSVAQPVARSVTGSVNVPPAAPIISSVTISGGTLVGDVLSSSISYTQVPVPSATPTYQWDRDGSPISGATSASYTLVEADAGAAITLDVSVTNSEGSDSATSNTINAAALAVPSITGVPTISGTLYEGNTLTATAASVTGNPTPATTWQWERDGTPISGATSQTYTLVSADGNADITVVQTETNSQGSDTAESAASTIEAAPVISGVPTISGSESVGSTLTAAAASVTGTPTPTRTWQWQRSADGSTGWTNISGATASTYTLVSADENEYVRAVQTETNTSGGQVRSDSAASAASGQIAAASGLPLDTVTSAVLAFSTARKLRTAYTGDAIRVRRSSDNTEQDIGFDGSGNLDESALTTFVGANDGFVVTWYDQSGDANAVDLTQSTAADQPKIVIGGVVQKKGGFPTVRHDLTGASAQFLTATSWSTRPSSAAWIQVAASPASRSFIVAISCSGATPYSGAMENGSSNTVISNPGSTDWYVDGPLTASDGDANARDVLFDAFADDALHVLEGQSIPLSTSGYDSLRTEYTAPGSIDPIEHQTEIIVLDGNTDAATIRADQGSYYGITLA